MSKPVNLIIQNTFDYLFTITLGAVTASGLSAGISRFTPITLSNPMDAAKFTTTAALALMFNLAMFKTSGGSKPSKLTFLSLTIYAIHHIANPEKTIASFAKLSTIAVVSLFFGRVFSRDSRRYEANIDIDKVGYKMAKKAINNSLKTVAAAGSAWLTARTYSKLGLDPKVTMVFTAVASLLYYATKPLFTALEEGNINISKRAASLLNLTKVAADLLKLNLPLYKEFAKACSVAGTFIAIFDNIDRLFPDSSVKKNQGFDFDEESLTEYYNQELRQ